MINLRNPDFALTPANPSRMRYGYRLQDVNARPVISIVTPFYNTGEVFQETAHSILNQSLQQWEWLIINDGSEDPEAIERLAKYRHLDPRVRVIDHGKNRGLSAARNTGISQASCEYILLVDSDDLLEPTAAEKWWWYLETHPQQSFVASYHVAFGGLNYLWTGGFHDGVLNTERNRVSMICMIRRSVYEVVGGFDELIRGGLEDWDFWMRCADRGFWGATIPEYLAWYRVRRDHSDRWENLNDTRLAEYRARFQEKYPALYQGHFPHLVETVDLDLTIPAVEGPACNAIEKNSSRWLMILPWLVMGGAERFVLNLMDQLIQMGWEISMVTTAPSDNSWLDEFEKRSSDIFILPNFLPIKDYLRFIGYLVHSRNFDGLFLQGSHEGYRLLPSLRSMFPNLPVMDFLHFVTPEWMAGGFPRLSLLSQDCIDLTLASCEQVRSWMVAEGADAERIKVCHIGVDPKIWKPDPPVREQVRRNFNIDPLEPVILFAARLEEQKQPLVFAETLALLSQKGIPFRALVAGDGSLKSDLTESLQKHGLTEKVTLLGSVPTEEMPALMAAADIFFLPSKNEGISQAFYEAMASGLIVVGSFVGGQAELVTPDCGFLLSTRPDQNEPEMYAQTLSSILCEPERRQQMSQASRSRILAQFSLDDMGKCVFDHLDSIIQAKKISPQASGAGIAMIQSLRETRSAVEFLQARQEAQRVTRDYADLYARYSQLVQPRPPSYWFYLWIRQLFFPLYNWINQKSRIQSLQVLKEKMKKILVNRSS